MFDMRDMIHGVEIDDDFSYATLDNYIERMLEEEY